VKFVQGHVTIFLMKQGSYHDSSLKKVLGVALPFLMPVTGVSEMRLKYKEFNCKLREQPC
jgi:hypothetical protein